MAENISSLDVTEKNIRNYILSSFGFDLDKVPKNMLNNILPNPSRILDCAIKYRNNSPTIQYNINNCSEGENDINYKYKQQNYIEYPGVVNKSKSEKHNQEHFKSDNSIPMINLSTDKNSQMDQYFNSYSAPANTMTFDQYYALQGAIHVGVISNMNNGFEK